MPDSMLWGALSLATGQAAEGGAGSGCPLLQLTVLLQGRPMTVSSHRPSLDWTWEARSNIIRAAQTRIALIWGLQCWQGGGTTAPGACVRSL